MSSEHSTPEKTDTPTINSGPARGMPASFYTSPEVFAQERQQIFLKHWFFAGREDELPNPGDYRAIDSVGGPVLLIRGDDGLLRAFANYCRHRGSALLEGEGNCRRIVCPYHAWSYLTDGRLHGCPDMKDTEGFDRAAHGLVPLRQDSWAGFLFLSFSSETPALLDYLGDLPERLASHKLERVRCTWKTSFDCACNWKLILENAMETYHTGIVHKDTVGRQTSRTIETRGNWLCIQVMDERSIATLPGSGSAFPPIAGLDEDARKGTYFTIIHPTCQFAVAQDSMWWLNVLPLAHDRSVLEIGGCFPQDVTAREDFNETAAAYYDRWQAVGREDVAILEGQQSGLSSVLYRPGPLSWRDDQVQAAANWVLARIPGIMGE